MLSTVLVAPTSRSAPPRIFRPTITVNDEQTQVLIEQTSAVAPERLGELVGRATVARADGVGGTRPHLAPLQLLSTPRRRIVFSLALVDPEGIVASIFEEAWNRQDFETVTPALTEFRFHIRGTTRSMELDDLKRIVQDWHAAFPDLRFDIHAIVVNDGRAGVHATLRGTHRGPWQGLVGTGRKIEVEHMFFFRFDGQRITDVWELLDSAQLRDQLER